MTICSFSPFSFYNLRLCSTLLVSLWSCCDPLAIVVPFWAMDCGVTHGARGRHGRLGVGLLFYSCEPGGLYNDVHYYGHIRSQMIIIVVI